MIETMFFTIVKDRTGYLPTPIIMLTLQCLALASAVVVPVLYSFGIIDGVITNSILLGGSVLLIIGSICAFGYFNGNKSPRSEKVMNSALTNLTITSFITLCLGLVLGYGASIEGLLHGVPGFATHSPYDILIAGALSFVLSLVVSVATVQVLMNDKKKHCYLVFSVPITVGFTAGAVVSEIVRYYLAEGVPPELLIAATTLVYAGVAAFVVATLSHIMEKYVSPLQVSRDLSKLLQD